MATQLSFVRSIPGHDNFIWFISALLSCTVCSVFFVLSQNKLNAAPAALVHETITHVRFSTPAPPPVSVVQPVVEEAKPEPPKEEKIIPPEPVIEKPQPKLKPKPEPKPKKEPKKKKKPLVKKKPPLKRKIVKKKTVKPKPPLKKIKLVEKQKTVSQDINPDLHKEVKAAPVAARVDPRIIEQTRMTYHALLMRHIEVHKNYPRIARKRNIEGQILVSFTLLENGQIKNIVVNGKKRILKKASLQAINDALPMPEAPQGLSLPMEVKFNMNYFLVK